MKNTMIVGKNCLVIESSDDISFNWSPSGSVWNDVTVYTTEPIPHDFIPEGTEQVYISKENGVTSINLGTYVIDGNCIVFKPKSGTYLSC